MPTSLRTLIDTNKHANRGKSPSAFAAELAATLGWGLQDAQLHKVAPSGVSAVISEASLAGQPTLLFCGHNARNSNDVLPSVALFAYHSAIEWGVLTNRKQTILFNSHWLRNDQWYQSPPFSLDELLANEGLFQALGPHAIAQGDLVAATKTLGPPDQRLIPVDDALVDRLDQWRDETLKHTETFRGIDERLQQLFAQLFVLRSTEDRGLAKGVPSLSTALRPDGTANKTTLRDTFRLAKERIQSELFEASSFKDIPPFILGGIIKDLYAPSHIPIGGAKYNFAWLSSAVLGRAYEKYLSVALIPSKILDRQLKLWNQPVRGVERIGVRKASGAYYTPDYIARFLTERCLDSFFNKSPDAIPTVIDPSCGSGTFLVTALDSLLRRLPPRKDRNWGRWLVEQRKICGIDVDPRAVTLAQLSVWLRLAEEPSPLPLPELRRDIVVGDALEEQTWAHLPPQFDVVLGNPPFLAQRQLKTRAELSERFTVAEGRFDFSYLFVELAVNHLANGGQLGLVVPNRVLSARDAAPVRELLSTKTRLQYIVDFVSQQVFEGADVYVSLIIAGLPPPSADSPPRMTRVVRIKQMPANFRGHYVTAAALEKADIELNGVSGFDIKQPSGRKPWVLLPQNDIRARYTLEDRGRPLNDIVATYQGIKTGANDIFILTLEDDLGFLYRVENGLGDRFEVERELLRPVVFGSDIKRYESVSTNKFLLYPYKGGDTLDETTLKKKYPRGYSYLQSMKGALEARESIIRANKKWYELAWERDEAWLNQKKLLTRELATQSSFAIDGRGDVFLVGGIALVPAAGEWLLPLLAYLNSKFADWYLRATLPTFQSAFYKFEKQHLGELPVPDAIIDGSKLAHQLGDLAARIVAAKAADQDAKQLELEVDELLAAAFDLKIRNLE